MADRVLPPPPPPVPGMGGPGGGPEMFGGGGGGGRGGTNPGQNPQMRPNPQMPGQMNGQMQQLMNPNSQMNMGSNRDMPMGMNQTMGMDPRMNSAMNQGMNQGMMGQMNGLNNPLNNSLNNQLSLSMNSQLGQLVPANQYQKAMMPYLGSRVMDLRDETGFPDSINSHHYEALTIRRASPEPGHSPTWAKIKITKMPISANEILASYSKHIKLIGSGAITKAYKSLRSDKMRTAIDRATQQRNADEPDRNYEWVLVHLDVTKKPIKVGFTTAYETSQIDMILKKSLKPEAMTALAMGMGSMNMHGLAGMQNMQALQNMTNLQNQAGMQGMMGNMNNMNNMPNMQNMNQRMNPGNNMPFGGQNGMGQPPNMGGHGQMGGHMNTHMNNNHHDPRMSGALGHGHGGQLGNMKPNAAFPPGIQPVQGQPININVANRSSSKDKKSKSDKRTPKFSDSDSDRGRRRKNNDSYSDDSSSDISDASREFKHRMAKHHGKGTDQYQRLTSGRSKSRLNEKSRARSSSARRRSATPAPRRRNSSRRRSGSESDESWAFLNHRDGRSSDGDLRSQDSYDEEYRRSRHHHGRRSSMAAPRHSSSSLSRPPSLDRRRSRTGVPGDSIVRHVHEYRIPADEDPLRRPLGRTLSYPNGARAALPPVPHASEMTNRQLDAALRYQEEKRAYLAGRRDAETEYGSWDGDSVSDVERQVRRQRDRVGRRLSGLGDEGWSGMRGGRRQADWP